MNLKEIASVSGKSGLFKILKPTRNGVILETIDSQKTKHVAGASSKVSILSEISIYTTGKEGNKPLEQVMLSLHKKSNGKLSLDPKTASNEEMKALMLEILPDYDAEKVYVSDIKKLISWYLILVSCCPELFKEEEKKEVLAENKEDAKETDSVEASSKPTKAKVAKEPKSVATAKQPTKVAKQNTNTKNVAAKSLPSKRGS
ncbi:MAG: DUF5606 domain-containing protein [Cytophagales bacterium]